MKRTLLIVALATALAACSEKPQTLGDGKQGASSYTGTGKAFVKAGWKQGDQVSWESHLKARAQYGQNDYSRMN